MYFSPREHIDYILMCLITQQKGSALVFSLLLYWLLFNIALLIFIVRVESVLLDLACYSIIANLSHYRGQKFKHCVEDY